ncbi:MAG: hypothetical protein KKA73_17345 [Chloroflexi bacterium]|nr:hypothetical protein [Chloroflexota bacterium]
MIHLYLCPTCGRTFELTDSEPIPDHQSRGCSYQGPGQRLTFTLAEAAQGIDVGILRAYADGDAARRARAVGQPRFTVARVQIEESS